MNADLPTAETANQFDSWNAYISKSEKISPNFDLELYLKNAAEIDKDVLYWWNKY